MDLDTSVSRIDDMICGMSDRIQRVLALKNELTKALMDAAGAFISSPPLFFAPSDSLQGTPLTPTHSLALLFVHGSVRCPRKATARWLPRKNAQVAEHAGAKNVMPSRPSPCVSLKRKEKTDKKLKSSLFSPAPCSCTSLSRS